MAKKDIEKTQIQKGQVLNPKGRPPKFLSVFTKQIKEEFLEINQNLPSSGEVKENLKALLLASRKKLIEVAKDDNAPIFLALTAKEFLTGKNAFRSMLDIEYFCYGKPQSDSKDDSKPVAQDINIKILGFDTSNPMDKLANDLD